MLSKLDGDARGGAALSIRAATGKPQVYRRGREAGYDRALPPRPYGLAYSEHMGGVLTAPIEKAEQNFDEKALETAEEAQANRFTLSDYLDQMGQLKNMGDLGDIMGMLPGIDSKALKGAKLDEKAMARAEAIILS